MVKPLAGGFDIFFAGCPVRIASACSERTTKRRRNQGSCKALQGWTGCCIRPCHGASDGTSTYGVHGVDFGLLRLGLLVVSWVPFGSIHSLGSVIGAIGAIGPIDADGFAGGHFSNALLLPAAHFYSSIPTPFRRRLRPVHIASTQPDPS